MPAPELVGSEHEVDLAENGKYKQIVTSTISVRGKKGRKIYIYLDPCDSLEYRGSKRKRTRVTVKLDMKGHRHWQIRLSANDSLGTGRLDPPPPPPTPGGGG